MSEFREAAYQADLEVRAEQRTVVGICVPFDLPTDIGRYIESFKRGAFSKTIQESMSKVKFLAAHDAAKLPLGRATLLREDANGLYGEFKVSKTHAGDEVLELIKDGALDAFSIGFRPVPARDSWNHDRSAVVRHEVMLREVSVVTFPAFQDAKILAVREFDVEQDAPKLSIARKRLLAL